jgi:hypothetical protein
VIEDFEIIFRELVCLEVSVVAGNTFPERAQSDIKVLDVFSNPSLQSSSTPFPFSPFLVEPEDAQINIAFA